MPVLMRLERLLEAGPLTRRLRFPPGEQSRLLQHSPNARRTDSYTARVSASSACTCRVRESAEGTRPAGSRHLHRVRIAGSLEIAEALRLRSRSDRFSRSAPIGSYRENPP